MTCRVIDGGRHVRFTWQLVHAGGEDALATGYDFATLAPDGRLRDITGFPEIPEQGRAATSRPSSGRPRR